MTPMPEDCKAAADWMDSYSAEWDTTSTNKVRAGDLSFGEGLPEAFMRHRLAAEAAAFEKAAGVLEQAIGDGYEVPAVKGDQCVHGRFGWEDCIACYDKELLRTATDIRKLAGEKHD